MKYPHVIAALAVGALGCLFILIGMATTGWLIRPGVRNVGIFLSCTETECVSLESEGTIAATRAFVVIAFMCSLGGAIECLVYYIKYIRKDTIHRTISLVMGVVFLIAAVSALIGAIIFAASDLVKIGKENGFSLGYSFALTIVGGLFCAPAGSLAIIHYRTSQI